MALAAISVARACFGLNVGEDVSIVGFDDIDMARWPVFDLTTFSQPLDDMVRRAVAAVLDQVNGTLDTALHDEAPGRLIVRGSARKPPTGLATADDGALTWSMRG
jgi:DNA-binding LacI/PurR family transcriptional regulator